MEGQFFDKKKGQDGFKEKKEAPIRKPKAYKEYTKGDWWEIQERKKEKQRPTSSHLHPNQNKKSNKVGGPSTIQITTKIKNKKRNLHPMQWDLISTQFYFSPKYPRNAKRDCLPSHLVFLANKRTMLAKDSLSNS